MDSIPTRGNDIFNSFISLLWSLVQAKCGIEFTTQQAILPEFSRKWRAECLTLGSLCQPCYIRNTACSWKKLFLDSGRSSLAAWCRVGLRTSTGWRAPHRGGASGRESDSYENAQYNISECYGVSTGLFFLFALFCVDFFFNVAGKSPQTEHSSWILSNG